MKNIYKKIFSIIVVLTLFISCTCIAYATENNTNITARSNYYEGGGIDVDSISWTTVATSSTGFGCNVQINTQNTATSYVSVRMLDSTGTIERWIEINAIPFNKSRVFYCGTDVHIIQVKCVSGYSTVGCWPTSKTPGIY